jgi:hypothetical protein
MIGLDPPCPRHLRPLTSFPFLAASIRKVELQPPMAFFTHFSSSCLASISSLTYTPLWTPCALLNGATLLSLLLGAAGRYVSLTGSNKHCETSSCIPNSRFMARASIFAQNWKPQNGSSMTASRTAVSQNEVSGIVATTP